MKKRGNIKDGNRKLSNPPFPCCLLFPSPPPPSPPPPPKKKLDSASYELQTSFFSGDASAKDIDTAMKLGAGRKLYFTLQTSISIPQTSNPEGKLSKDFRSKRKVQISWTQINVNKYS